MKPYKDVLGKALTKGDVQRAVQAVVGADNAYPSNIQRQLKVGYGKAVRLISVLHHAGVVSGPESSPRVVILKGIEQATNAALRQLKKGRK